MLLDLRKVYIGLTLFLIFGIAGIFRDLFILPLFSYRLYLLFLIAFSFIAATRFVFSEVNQSVSMKVSLTDWTFKKTWVFGVISLAVLQGLKSDSEVYLLFQLSLVVISIFIVDHIIRQELYDEFLKYLKTFMLFMLILMVSIWLLWLLGFTWVNDARTRNSLPYIFFGGYLILKASNKENKYLFILAFFMAYICETRGAMILFGVYYTLDFLFKRIKAHYLKRSLIILILTGVNLAPVIFSFAVEFWFDININDIINFEQYRYGIPDNITSSISRIYGVVWLLFSNLEEIFPFGTLLSSSSEEFLFWGYPVHNFFMILLLKYGFVGMILSFLLIYMNYRLLLMNLGLGLALLFCMVTFNDFLPGFVIFLIPFLAPLEPDLLSIKQTAKNH